MINMFISKAHAHLSCAAGLAIRCDGRTQTAHVHCSALHRALHSIPLFRALAQQNMFMNMLVIDLKPYFKFSAWAIIITGSVFQFLSVLQARHLRFVFLLRKHVTTHFQDVLIVWPRFSFFVWKGWPNCPTFVEVLPDLVQSFATF